ncbi:MAG: nitroreductase, partial [archaeon]|nr:nitroreductase [archaeon]
MNAEDLLTLMKERRSIRTFKSDPISEENLRKILEAARWCQSGSNKQPWRLIIIRNRKVIEDLTKIAIYGKFINQVSIVIAIVANKNIAPKWYIHDTSMVSHQICLMAWSLGLGTCWIGTFDRNKGAKILDLKEEEHLTTILPIGIPKLIPNPTPRKKM